MKPHTISEVARAVASAALCVGLACGGHPAPRARPPTLVGHVEYDDGSQVNAGLIRLTGLGPGASDDVVSIEPSGAFQSSVRPGTYALSAATGAGFQWLKEITVPSAGLRVVLRKTCHVAKGRVQWRDKHRAGARVKLQRQSSSTGDTFLSSTRPDGTFALCLPEGQYAVSLDGPTSSANRKIDVPGSESVVLTELAVEDLERAPARSALVRSDLEGLVDEILRVDPILIGMGEATHGTAELYTHRSQLTFELIRRGGLRLILLENDAIASAALDDYINGAEVDLARAVSSLGFWTTDVFEFHQFLQDLRQYNATAIDKVHVRGIDIQNTTRPVELLLRSADLLGIGASDGAILRRLEKRGAGVEELSAAERGRVDAVLARLAVPRGATEQDLRVAVAARSLALQLGYWVGDTESWSSERRELGMTAMAAFLVARSGGKRACVWAHVAHISKELGELRLGYHLSKLALSYYAIGFYLHSGTARAWDLAQKVGVVSQPIPAPASYNVESVLLAAAGPAKTAWVSLRQLPPALQRWFDLPRYVRELYAVYEGPNAAQILRDIRAGFDALVVIPVGHDSTPTPTGTRTAP